MVAADLAVLTTLDSLYVDAATDLSFAQVMAHRPGPISDAALADLIDADGRYRMARNLPLDLDRYLSAIPDLADRPEPLDAAIDMAFRAMARTSRIDDPVVHSLIASHPELATAIREAAVLNQAVWTTTQVQEATAPPKPRPLPSDFGPHDPSGAVRRYELQQLLGEGGFGQVYLAADRHLSEAGHQALVSIKVLPGSDRSEWSRQRLVDEATKARRVNHTNVVRVIDRGVSSDDEDFIVYEFIEGGDLARWVRRLQDPMTMADAARLTAKIARGVHAAHMAGLVHCDLKPANVVITAQGEPKVADFGIAIRHDQGAGPGIGMASPAAPMGNLAFMSPEQHNLLPGALNIPTDVYALGGILYWLITDDLPNGCTPEEVRQAHDPVQGRREPPTIGTGRGATIELDAICRRAMAFDPQQRYSSAAALADDLEAWVRHEPIPWTRPSLWRRVRLWARRKPTTAIAGAIIALLLIVGGGVLAKLNAGLRHEERKRSDFLISIEEFIGKMKEAQRQGVVTDLLPQLWFAEWMFGPVLLKQGVDPLELWSMRIELIRELIRRAEAGGEGGSVQTLMWESALGFWLINQGKFEEADSILAANEAKWHGLLTRDDDPWFRVLRTIRACAMIRHMAANGPQVGLPLDSPEFKAAVDLVTETEKTLNDVAPDTPMHRQVHTTLKALYGPTLLNDPARVPPPIVPLTKRSAPTPAGK